MKHPPNPEKGYSIIELVLVIAIIGILSIAGISMLGNRTGGSVRGVLDEIEGSLMEAHKLAVATGQDVLIVTQGEWNTANPLIMARGVVTPASTPATILADGQTATESFRVAVAGGALSREHAGAGISVLGSTWWDNAKGTNEDIMTVAPFSSPPVPPGFMGGFSTALVDANKLFTVATNSVRISGGNKRFNSTFWIPVVGLNNGNAIPGGPMGVILVQNNGATIFKFYNPGVRNGDGKWRRI